MSILTTLALTLMATLAQGIEESPIIVAVLSLLAIPAITSGLTGLLKNLPVSIKPETVVYVASLILTGIVVLGNGGEMPLIDLGSPAETVAAWLAWAKVNSSSAQMVYDILRAKLLTSLA